MFNTELKNTIARIVNSQNSNLVDTLLNEAGVKDVGRRGMIHQLAENTRKFLMENATESQSVISYVPAYIPMMTRLMPSIITLELVGVQPMNSPVGIVWAYRMYLSGKSSTYQSGDLTANFYDGLVVQLESFASTLGLVSAETSGTVTTYQIYDNVGASVLAIARVLHQEAENKHVFLRLTSPADARLTSRAVVDQIDALIKASGNITLRTSAGVPIASSKLISTFRNWKADYLFNFVFRHYTGGVGSTQGDTVNTGVNYLEGWEGVDDVNNLKFTVEHQTITAKTRKLKVNFTMEALQDTQALYKGYDIQNEMLKIAVRQLGLEIDQEILFKIKERAGVNDVTLFDFNLISGIDISGKVKALMILVEKLSTDIALDTRLGAGNFIITNSRGVGLLASIPGAFVRTQDYESLGSAFQKAGILNGAIKVFLDPYSSEDAIYIGHKGATEGSAGIIFAPYIPIQVRTLQDPNTFDTHNLIFTRYAIVDDLRGSEKFYRKLLITNLGF